MSLKEVAMKSIKEKLDKNKLTPPRVLALGFASLILIGSIILNLPMATKNNESIGFINALFTAASSVCVTGLVVVNTAEVWSSFGQIVIIFLIQIGGLGFMTITTMGAVMVGKKIGLKDRLLIKEQLNQDSISGLVKLTKYVVGITLAIEGLGALFLSTRFIPMYGLQKGIWFSIFHSISGFCNAGFDIIGNSMESFSGDIIVNMTIASLIIVGGLGFSVYVDISEKKSFGKLRLHSKLVLSITGLLLLIGTVIFLLIEFNNPLTLGDMGNFEKVLTSFFQSVISRTAGFNSVDIGGLKDTTVFFMILLMFIGGSPGSTGGGIKTTTFGVLVLTTYAVVKGEKDVVVYKKRIGNDIIFRALAIIVISLGFIILVSFILTITEPAIFLDLLFETTSAFATVGISRGITPGLTNIGKLIIILTMYAGRVGPLTMAFAFAQRSQHKNYSYSEGSITVG